MNSVDAAAFYPGPHDVISPELVLVDPELAEIARRRLRDTPEWRPSLGSPVSPSAPVRLPFAHASPPSEPRRHVPRSTRALGAFAGAVPLLLLGALVVGMVASEVRAQLLADPATLVGPSTPKMTRVQTLQTTAALASEPRARQPAKPPRTVTPARPAASELQSPASPPGLARATPETEPSPAALEPTPVPADRGAAGRWVPEQAEVEARTLVALQQRVLFSVPAALIDKRTGLLVNNVHISCRRVEHTAQFSCKLGVGRSQAQEWVLTVVTARDGGPWAWIGPAAAR